MWYHCCLCRSIVSACLQECLTLGMPRLSRRLRNSSRISCPVVPTSHLPYNLHLVRTRAFLVKLLSVECHKIPLMINQHWFRWWLGAVRQRAITRAKVMAWCRQITSHYLSQCYPDLCRHMALIGYNELTDQSPIYLFFQVNPCDAETRIFMAN